MEMNYCPRFKDAVIVDEYMWFFDDEIQCVCKMKLVSSRITIVYRHDFTYRLLPQKVAYKAGVVYFINPNMLEILVYDIEKNTGRLITGENTEKCEKQYSAAYAIVQKDGVYIVPFFCSKELRYFEFSTNKIIIDYCFINEKITHIDYKLLDDSVNGKYPSDHFGIMATIEL